MKQKLTLIIIAILTVNLAIGQPTNWSGDTDIDLSEETVDVYAGNSSCKITVNSGTQANCDLTSDVTIPVNEGDSYTISIYAKTSLHVRIRIVYTWTGAAIGYSSTYAGDGIEDPDYVEFIDSGTVPAGATGLNIGLRCYDQTGFVVGEEQLVDEITFQSPTGTFLTVDNGDFELWPSGAAPVIENVVITPDAPTSSDDVNVTCDITDDGTITSASLSWGYTQGGPYDQGTIPMSEIVKATYVYSTDSDIPAQINKTMVYYVITAIDNDAETTVSDEYSYYVLDPATTTIPYTEPFDGNLGDAYTYSVSGDTKYWIYSSSEGGVAYMNGYNSGDLEEDWLIIPAIDFDSYSNEVLTFNTWYNYGSDDVDNYLKLYYSTDYAGVGDPTSANWTELSFTQPASSQTWTPSGDIDLSAISGSSVYIAFKYQYNVGVYRSWYVDDITVVEATSGGGATCAEAVFITPGTHHSIHTIDNDYDQWFYFVASVNGIANIENCASDVDMFIVIDQGTCGNTYDLADEDICGVSGYSEDFDFSITAGETYYIGLGNWDQATDPEYDWTLTETEMAIPVATIADLRAATLGNEYELTGEAVLTFQQSFRGQKFIQDATAGILIDDDAGIITTVYNINDGITGITGTLGEYGNMLQFVPTADPGPATSSGNIINPEIIDLASYVANPDNYEAELITIPNVTFTEGGGTFANGTEYEITDASKATATFRTTFYDVDYIGGTIPFCQSDITGIGNARSSGDYITSRNWADFNIFAGSVTSYVEEPGTQTPGTTIDEMNIDSLSAAEVFRFVITDNGDDGMPTKVSQITLYAGPSNTADFGNVVAGGYIAFDGGDTINYTGQPTVTANMIQLPMNSNEMVIADGTSQEFVGYIWINQIVKVTYDLQFMIDADNHGFLTEDACNSSQFITDFAGDIVGNVFQADIGGDVSSIFKNMISIHPNPSNGVFTVNVKDKLNLEVLDITGKVFSSQVLNGNTTVEIDAAGIYFFRFSNEQGSVTHKVIVQ